MKLFDITYAVIAGLLLASIGAGLFLRPRNIAHGPDMVGAHILRIGAPWLFATIVSAVLVIVGSDEKRRLHRGILTFCLATGLTEAMVYWCIFG